MLWKCCTQYPSNLGKLSSGHRTGKGQFSLQFQRKAIWKNVQTTTQLHSSHMLASSVQSLSCVSLFVTPCTAACQASLSITYSQTFLKLMSIESVMPSNHLILCRPLPLPPSIFPSIRGFSNESGGQSIGVSSSASVLSVNIQDWSPLGWTGLISSMSKGLSRAFSNTRVKKHQFISVQLSF